MPPSTASLVTSGGVHLTANDGRVLILFPLVLFPPKALSAHKVCTPDEALCVKQDRVVAILMVKNRSTDATVVENFGMCKNNFFLLTCTLPAN